MRKLSSVILADLVTSKRKEKSMTQQSLAEATGINRALISRIEKQDFIPSIPQLEQLGEVLGFEPDSVFADTAHDRLPSPSPLRIAVAGTGYVGLSIATLLAQHNHVTAVDILPEKVDLINRRKSPIQDDYIEKYLAEKEVYATDVEPVGLDGTKAVIHIGAESFAVTIPIAGEHNVYNALAAVCVAGKLGLSVDEMKRGIESVKTIGGRSNLIHKGGMTIIDDCYNANPVSMKASIDVLAAAPGRKIAVLGDMGELGENEQELHAMVGEHFEGKGIDALFAAGALSENLAQAVRKCSKETEVHYFKTKDELMEELLPYVKSGDTVLVKASHFMGFTEVVGQLTK